MLRVFQIEDFVQLLKMLLGGGRNFIQTQKKFDGVVE